MEEFTQTLDDTKRKMNAQQFTKTLINSSKGTNGIHNKCVVNPCSVKLQLHISYDLFFS